MPDLVQKQAAFDANRKSSLCVLARRGTSPRPTFAFATCVLDLVQEPAAFVANRKSSLYVLARRGTSPRPTFAFTTSVLALLLAGGCGGTEIDWSEEAAVEQQQLDAGTWDDASYQETDEDAGTLEIADAGTDLEAADAGTVTPPPSDAGMPDAGPVTAPPDAGAFDAGPVDPPTPDAGTFDAGSITPPQPDAGTPDAGSGCPLRVYVAPDGRDARDGLTEATAVLTLGRVQTIVKEAAPRCDVEVRIATGRYQGQTVTWTFTMPTHRITFMPLHDDRVRPVFDGCLVENVTAPATQCPGGTWFILNRADGQETNLHFEYLRVERYTTAISFNGQRNAEATSNGSNRIFGCYFASIGNEFNPALSPSTAAVRLVNSDDNQIVNNHFVDIVNTTSGGLLHAIYAAHMSDRNLIQSNRFQRGSGDPVRLRDYSNDNRILQNRFLQSGSAGYSDWYCDHEVNEACTKPTPECPSWRNQFRDNTLDGSWSCDPLRVWVLYQDDTTGGCTRPTGAARVSTSGNVQVDPPCAN